MNTTTALRRLDPEAPLSWDFPDVEESYTFRDSILYALGLGLPRDPLDREGIELAQKHSA